jgi:hypothetical protein
MTKYKIRNTNGYIVGELDLSFCKTDLEVLAGQNTYLAAMGLNDGDVIFEEMEAPVFEQTKDRIVIPALFCSYNPLKDKSINLRFNTGELSDNMLVLINRLMNTNGVLIYRNADKVNEDDLQTIDKLNLDLYDAPKSCSQRLKSVLFLAWKKDNKGHATADDYYKAEMEKVIVHFKKRLDDVS